MKFGVILLAVLVLVSGILAFSGMVQAAMGAMKAVFFCAIALLALLLGLGAFAKGKIDQG